MSVNGSTEIRRHDQLRSPVVQLRKVSESVRMLGHEKSFPVSTERGLAFFSRLKSEGISDEDYPSCQEAWRENGMTTLRDFLVWYNNRDVIPFLQAIHRHVAFYEQRGIDMFKQNIRSAPGLTLFYLFNDFPEKTYFTFFNETPVGRWRGVLYGTQSARQEDTVSVQGGVVR